MAPAPPCDMKPTSRTNLASPTLTCPPQPPCPPPEHMLGTTAVASLLTAPYQEGRRELRLQGPENMPEPTQLRIPRGRIPTPDSRLQPSSSGKGAPPKAAARALSAVLNQRSHGRPPTGLAKVPSHLAQEGALISFASFPEFLLVKCLNCGLDATSGK